MNNHSVAHKIFTIISSLSLVLQSLSPLASIIPTKVFAAESLKTEVDFNKDTNKFGLKVNNKDANADGPIDYVLVYRTDKGKNEAIKGSSEKDLQDNFNRDFYAGTCSSDGTCIPDAVVRGILKVEVISQNWITAQKFAIDDGKLKLVEEYTPADSDPANLTNAENYWLENGMDPSPTPTATSTLSPTPTIVENGQILDGISTTNTATDEALKEDPPVELGKEYIAPFNDKLKIVFTKLPAKPGTIKMKELFVSFNVTTGEQIGSAYEITSDMVDGTFLYDLTLPVPVDSKGNLEGTSEGVDSTGVSYSEDGSNFNSVTNEKSLDKNNNVITIKNLDHFTIFVLVANPSGITNGMLSAIGDTYIKQDSGGNDNFGGSDPINIYSQTTSKNRRILVKFDLTSIPTGSSVSTATLKLKMTNAPGTSRQYDAYQVTSSWDENTVTWNTQPTIAGSATSSVSSGTTNVVLSWNVTVDINAFLSGTTNNGWLIRDNAEDSTSANTNQASFASKENGTNSNRPQLSIDFSIASPANTGPSASGGFNSPTAQSAITTSSGDNDGYGTSPTNAFAGDGTFTTDTNSGANNNSDCSNSGTGVDRHIFNNYGISIPGGATINGIEVRQDLKASSLADSPFTCVQLSWDAGITWTSVKQKSLSSTDLTPYYFGSSSDLWGRSWSISDFSNSNFRVRVANGDTDNAHSTTDFSLDWIPVRVYYTQDTTAPTLTQVTPVTTPTNDSTPNYTFNSSEAGTISYGGDCSSGTTSASAGDNTITFNSLSDGTHSNCTINVTDGAGNTSSTLNVSSFMVDTTAPTDPADVNSTSHTVSTPSNDTTIDMAWTAAGSMPGATDVGSGVDGYSYSFTTGSTDVPDTVKDAEETATGTTSTALADGSWYFHLRTRDNVNNWTSTVHVGPYIIDATVPVLSEVTPVSSPTNDTTPDYTFNSTEAGNISYSGDCSSSTGTANSGNNTITFNTLSEGTHSNCTIQVTDSAGNPSNVLNVSSFTVDTTPPTVTINNPNTSPAQSKTITADGGDGTLSQSTTTGTVCDGTLTFGAYSSTTFTSESDNGKRVCYKSVDTAGNTAYSLSNAIAGIDTTEPSLDSKTTFSGWYTTNKTSTFNYSDSGSGIVSGTPVTCTISTEGLGQTCSVTPNVCDAAGNCNTTQATSNPADIDKTDPVDPSVISTSHSTSVWSMDNTIDVSWSGATDNVSGVAGYSYLFDTASGTVPDDNSEGLGTSTTSTALADGNSNYFHLRTGDNANNWTSTVHLGPFYIDTTPPATPSASPPAGDYLTHQSVTLSSSDATSGVAAIYYTTDGSTPNATKTLYSSPIAVNSDLTIKAISYDNAGNASSILTAVYGIAPIISSQSSFTLSGSSATITWTTDIPSTSRVIYDTVSHAGSPLGAAPNYGYASLTTEDSAKVTSHSVTISGLTDGATYWYRTVSHGSPDQVGDEEHFGTFSKTSGNTGDGKGDGRGGGGGGGAVAAAPAVAGVSTAFNPAFVAVPAEVLGVSSPEAELTATPSPGVLGKMKGPEVKSESKLSKILLIASLIILISLVVMYIKKKKEKPTA